MMKSVDSNASLSLLFMKVMVCYFVSDPTTHKIMTIHYCFVCFSLVGTDVTIFWLPYMFLGDSLCNHIDIYCNEEECDLRDL
jgi:hypothetical protein